MNKEDVISFFNRQAPTWDRESVRQDDVISEILNISEINETKSVLDVGCGTGFLFSDYLKRNVTYLTGIDISPNMIKIAKEKYPFVDLICADCETYTFKNKYDVIMIHNAYPHFENPSQLFCNLLNCLNSNGRITVAHSISREKLNELHNGKAVGVSHTLETADDLSLLMKKFLNVDTVISDDKMYIVSGTKK